jgi:FkbM family methyltransferase
MWPQGTIHAFEPVPTIYRALLNNVRGLRNVRCYPLALSDTNGVGQLHISGGESIASSSLLVPQAHLEDHPGVHFRDTIQITTVTLPQWQRDHAIDQVDFLWLDMQGYELAVLKAATATLPTVKAIYTEVSLKETYQGVPLYGEVKAWLEGQGFCVEAEAMPWPDMGNVLFVKA